MLDKYIGILPEKIEVKGHYEARIVEINNEFLDQGPSLKIRNHSPDGFNWGYGGSGPAQLSLAILMKYLPVEYALELYQDFKFSVVGKWPQSDFEIELNLKQELLNMLVEK